MTLFKNKYRIESARLKGWDYADAGWYFVTICTQNREPYFGQVVDQAMSLSPIGEIAHQYWSEIPQHSPSNIQVDAFIIMPNHVHGIVVIEDTDGRRDIAPHGDVARRGDVACNVSTGSTMSKISPKVGSLGAIVRSYKSAVTRWARMNHQPFFDWQARFFDHIIRDEKGLNKIRDYIATNPAQWDTDRNNLANLWM